MLEFPIKDIEKEKADKNLVVLSYGDNPKVSTGYGQVWDNLLTRWCKLRPNWKFYHLGWQNRDREHKRSEGYTLLPMNKLEYGFDTVTSNLLKYQPDIFVTLCDVGWQSGFIDGVMKARAEGWRGKWIAYTPIDTHSWAMTWDQIFDVPDVNVAMAKWGEEYMKKHNVPRVRRIDHGVDLETFYPLINRAELKNKHIPNKFVVGFVGRNQQRKMIDRLIKGFAMFAQNKDDVILMMHTDKEPPKDGWSLPYMQWMYGIKDKLRLSKPELDIEKRQMISPSGMNEVYNLMDVFCFSCFHPNTPVLLNGEIKNIKDIEIGDIALTNKGFNKVIDKKEFDCENGLLEITPSGLMPIKVTPNHLIFRYKGTAKWSKSKSILKNKTINGKGILEEISADKLRVGDVMVVPRLKTSIPAPYSKDLIRLFGLYIAEGCLLRRKDKIEGITFCINTKEEELTKFILETMKQEFNLKGHVRDDTRHRRQIRFYSIELESIFSQFGIHAENKTIPLDLIQALPEQQKYLLRGLFDGDGCSWTPKNRSTRHEYQTVSRQLAYQIWSIILKLGFVCSLKEKKRQNIVYKLEVNSQQSFSDILGRNEIKRKKRIQTNWITDDYCCYVIRKIKKLDYSGKVYDLTIEKEHNYCSPLLGHNTGGEGFGLPGIEAQASGIPIMMTEWTTGIELTENHGWKIPVLKDIYGRNSVIVGTNGVEFVIPDDVKIAEFLEEAYQDWKNGGKRLTEEGIKSRNFAENYNWDIIANSWIKLFEEIYE